MNLSHFGCDPKKTWIAEALQRSAAGRRHYCLLMGMLNTCHAREYSNIPHGVSVVLSYFPDAQQVKEFAEAAGAYSTGG